jgi:tetratricopeptide (TPR) repeat protein
VNDLRTIESLAFKAQRSGDYETAISLWLQLIEKVNNWEDGYAHYNVADCLERIGKFDEAEKHYAEAVKIAPHDDRFSIALSSLIEDRKAGLI